jgi:hypothetical protein
MRALPCLAVTAAGAGEALAAGVALLLPAEASVSAAPVRTRADGLPALRPP